MAGMVMLLAADEVRDLLEAEPLIDRVAEALRCYSDGLAWAPPRVGVESGHGRLVAMPGGLAGTALATKVYTQFEGNDPASLPTHQALIVVFDEVDGSPLAVMDGTSITAERTAAVSAAATRVLAAPEAASLAVIGSGAQAEAHLRYLPLVRSFDDIRVSARRPEAAAALAERAGGRAVSEVEEAVAGADVVCCCTSAVSALFDEGLIGPGAHVVSVGTGDELPHGLLDRASVFVEWSGSAQLPPPAGAAELAGRPVVELGEVLAGRHPGRVTEDEVTVWKSTGLAVEDVTAAHLVYQLAMRASRGLRFDFGGVLQREEETTWP